MKAKLVNPQNLSAPVITKVIPSSGTAGKVTEVAIIGKGFVEGAEIRIGGQKCQTEQFISENVMYCEAPPASASRVAAKVVNPNSRSFELADAFAYIESLGLVSGFTVSSGGGVSRGTNRMLFSTIGEGMRPGLTKSNSRTLVTGNEALHFDGSR